MVSYENMASICATGHIYHGSRFSPGFLPLCERLHEAEAVLLGISHNSSPCLQQYNMYVVPFQLNHFIDCEIFSNLNIIDHTFIYPSHILRHTYAATSAKQF